MKQALIVIDVQESFRRRPYFRDEELPRFLRNVQSLIDRCAARGIALLQVFHEEPGDDPGNPFSAASGCVRAMPELSLRADAVFYKQVHSAMFGRTEDGATLEAWLRERGIGELLISGIRTEQCCETTTRHASDLGFSVRYVSDATLTFPMQTRSGREVSAQEILERTELVLDGRFARIVSTADALA
ncbi:MAG: isochorismatase family protein [Gammaproteobacteria bacterium]|nr:MAG: isochorismatase family protein [Gammaproteobacteria bacterium]TLY90822.1 MAG: isochorismatase family protein [Gammaproteobacteria bacterium]TLY99178.1 MAG: isochorismatase family protein [Gammaproteobacteria bacterium]TLZ41267.1 MAG: isochorismatase family protein [Gammaproteobacteria bacterium]